VGADVPAPVAPAWMLWVAPSLHQWFVLHQLGGKASFNEHFIHIKYDDMSLEVESLHDLRR
jgi:hypothetical protein